MTTNRGSSRAPLPSREIQLLIILAAVAAGLYDFLHVAGFGFGHGFEMAAIARNLAAHGTYANPFQPIMTGPTALVPPLFPFLLAGLIKLLGQSPNVVIAAVSLNIATNALIAWMLPRLSVVSYGTHMPGTFAAALWLFSMRLMPQWDVSLTIAGLIAFCLVHSAAFARRSAGWTIAAGLTAGLVLLANPATAFVLLIWVGFLFFSRGLPWRHAARQSAIIASVAALCCVPWVVRNYGIWQAILMRTSFGITLFSSNNDCASSSLIRERRSGCFQRTHPVDSEFEAGLLLRMGEVRYDRLKKAEAIAWIRSHPRRFAQLTAERFVEFWFPDPREYPFRCYAIWLITVLSVPGAILMLRSREGVSAFILGVWLVCPPMYYIMVSSDRYRYPILWTSLLPAGYFLQWTKEKLEARRPAPKARERDNAVTA
jgi:hypothetical protein